jgi:peptidoglycan hydrolase CwlO-like protein
VADESVVTQFKAEQKKTNARLDTLQDNVQQLCDQMAHLSKQATDLCEMVKMQLAATRAMAGLAPD